MRSEHERIWAKYFTSIGLSWEYEPVTFRQAGHRYTPDFALLGQSVFVEIKTFSARNVHNAFHLCTKPLILIYGLPSKHYIRIKPAQADRFSPGHLKHWSHIYDAHIFTT